MSDGPESERIETEANVDDELRLAESSRPGEPIDTTDENHGVDPSDTEQYEVRLKQLRSAEEAAERSTEPK